jgi:hypothetical protein
MSLVCGNLFLPGGHSSSFLPVVGTKLITRRHAVSLPLRVATGQRDVQQADVKLLRTTGTGVPQPRQHMADMQLPPRRTMPQRSTTRSPNPRNTRLMNRSLAVALMGAVVSAVYQRGYSN